MTMDPLEEIELDVLEKFTYVNSLLSNEEREQLRLKLLRNIDIFTWRHFDVVGINPMVASHKLNVLPTAKPIRQNVRCVTPILKHISFKPFKYAEAFSFTMVGP